MLFATTASGGGDMAAFLTLLGTIAQSILNLVVQVAGLIVETPLFVFSLGFFFVGGCLGIVRRFISRG